MDGGHRNLDDTEDILGILDFMGGVGAMPMPEREREREPEPDRERVFEPEPEPEVEPVQGDGFGEDIPIDDQMLLWFQMSNPHLHNFEEGQSSELGSSSGENKRAKVHPSSNSREDHLFNPLSSFGENLSPSAYRGLDTSQTSGQSNNVMLNNQREENMVATSDSRDEGAEEELGVRMDFTDDLLHMVFSFLDHINLCRAALVSRQWRAASSHEDFWRCLNFENSAISDQQFKDICQRYPNATEVNISGTCDINYVGTKAATSLKNLEILTLGRGQLLEPFFDVLENCSKLQSLNINDAVLGNGIQEVTINNDKLHHVQLTKCRVMRLFVRCPKLETLSLKRSNMGQVVLNCPLLHVLDLASCYKLSDVAIRQVITSCPLLESLDMSNCSAVTDETLCEIARSCANLRFLDASYCPNISFESVSLPMLTVLKLHSCEGITSASMAVVSHFYMLEVLELDNCNLFTSVSLDLSHLHHIRFIHCRKFAEMNIRSLVLSSILVSNCPVLNCVNITSNSLEKLALQKQESLSMLTLQCQCLQEVDLSDCESLTSSVCEVFSDCGGCPMLKSLVLDNCVSMTAVRMHSTSLASLSLVGCRGITDLELSCPVLEKICLHGCDHIERASFCPVGLQSLNLGICPKLNVLHIEAPRMLLLELKGCGALSDVYIKCPLLTSLDASFCSQIKEDCLSATAALCPQIRTMILMSCLSVGPGGLYSLHSLQNLIVLDLSYTFLEDLQPVFNSCVQLKVLKLQACKYLNDMSLEPLYKEGALPSLKELDLSYGTICQSAIEELLASCTHLTHLNLSGCLNMHDLNWDSGAYDMSLQGKLPVQFLQNLNCVCCPNIRKVLIPPMARCFHLASLNLSLAANLREVDLACSSLCVLNMSNCVSLELLKLKCPSLSSLFLQSCNIGDEELEAAILNCSVLETLDVRFCPKIQPLSMGRLRAACPSLKRVFSSLSSSCG